MTSPQIDSYDIILVSSSSGKDSQTALRQTVKLADDAGVKNRVVVFHADLGRVEWPGSPALAEHQASLYGLRFVKESRTHGDPATPSEQKEQTEECLALTV